MRIAVLCHPGRRDDLGVDTGADGSGMAPIQKCYFECGPWTDGEHTRTGC